MPVYQERERCDFTLYYFIYWCTVMVIASHTFPRHENIARLNNPFAEEFTDNKQTLADPAPKPNRVTIGSSDGYCNAGNLYSDGNVLGRGIEQDKKKAKYYYELSSIMGNVDARYSVAGMELNTLGNTRRGYKHYLIAAKSGYELALRHVKEGYTKGHVTKDEFEDALRSYKKSADEMKSDARDEAAETVPSTTSPDCTIS